MNTIIDRELIKKSKDIFDNLEKWNAFNELQQLRDPIIENWLAIGTEQLRKHFEEHPPKGWGWETWATHVRDTRWYIKEFGIGSLAIGFWDYHLYLLKNDTKRLDPNWFGKKLKEEKGEYAKLLVPFGMNPMFNNRNAWVAEEKCDFTFGRPSDGNIKKWELAWYASHETENFVTQAAKKIERFVGDPEITRLLAKLNAEAQKTDA